MAYCGKLFVKEMAVFDHKSIFTGNILLVIILLLALAGCIDIAAMLEIYVTEGTTPIELSGEYDFGNIIVGSTGATTVFTIDNVGFSDLLLFYGPDFIILTGGASQFAILEQPTSPIPPGDASTFSIRFSPTAQGPTSAEAIIQNNDTSFSFTLAGAGVVPPSAAGVTVEPTSGLVTAETGGSDTFSVVLNTQPATTVTIGISSSDITEGMVSPSSLTFDTANWNMIQTVTITGVNDAEDDGDQGYTVVLGPADSTDPDYSGMNPADVSVTNTDDDSAQDPALEIASWNIRILSNGSRTDGELTKISTVIARYDMVAIQEVRDTIVLDRLIAMLPGWDYVVSAEVGAGVKERYAYFYKTDTVSPLGTAHVFTDTNDDFIREPIVAHFRSGAFDFTLITIHVVYGSTVEERRTEVRLLDEVLASVDNYNGNENDVILLGDFNLPPDDGAWQITTHSAVVGAATMTTITDTSSYDNVWINSTSTAEYQQFGEVYRFDEVMFAGDDTTASLEVSDHRPVSVIFSTATDDDSDGTWNETGGEPIDDDTRTDGDVRFYGVTASPTDSEQITIKNHSSWNVDISAWTLGDLNNPVAYNIPNGTILAPLELKQYVHTQLGFGINNSGETLYIKDGNGITIDTWSN